MRSSWRPLILTILMSLSLSAISSAQLGYQHSKKPLVVRYVRSETVRNNKIEKAIMQASVDARDSGNDDTAVRYYYNKVDLNGDGKPELLVYLFGKSICGSSGCGLLIFQLINGEYKLITDVSLVHNPVIVSRHKTHGWNDLIVFVVGGGIQPGYYAVLHFDGQSYPNNTNVDPAELLKTRVKGIAYCTGSASLTSGLSLRTK